MLNFFRIENFVINMDKVISFYKDDENKTKIIVDYVHSTSGKISMENEEDRDKVFDQMILFVNNRFSLSPGQFPVLSKD